MNTNEVQDHELDAWLDGALELTEEQRAEFGRLVRAYEATQVGRAGEDADYAEEDNAAWTAALMHACGWNDVAARGRAYREAQRGLYASAMIASLAGGSEVQVARDATISRNTLRQLLRKTPRRPLKNSTAADYENEGAVPRSRRALPGVVSRED